jgi:predicted helicase
MPRIEPELQRLQEIKTLPSLLKYLKEDLNWPIGSDDVEDVTFDYDPAELGFDSASTAKIDEVRQLRPLTAGQKWGIFWVKFGKKQLPVQMLRRALGNLVVKKRASTKKSDKAAWHMHDLLFISAYGDDDNRHITFAHFSESEDSEKSLPVLKVLGWDDDDTLLHLKDTYKTLVTSLNWENTPVDDPEAWRKHWSSAFKVGHREVINTTKELVVELAQLATVIKKSVLTSIKAETEKGPWKKLMLAFQKTLIKDLDEDQFADVIAQTVSYGLLTARLSSDGQINLKNLVDMVPSTNPFLKELLQHFLTSAGMKGLFDVDEAGINDVVELLNRANAQAIRNDFGKKTDGEDPVIHFYEHFLGAYNKKLKVERGVFYTPQPVVSYIVRSVHELLKEEFGLEDGLADTSTWTEVKKHHKHLKVPEGIKPDIEPFVQILDPATGTATFLIEVIDVIHGTMTAKWDKERVSKAEQIKKWNTYVPTHLLPRLYAYELMMAPYAIAHMKLGLKLAETGFTAWEKLGPENRANIFLTNALEPWEKQLQLIGFDALAHEAAEVNEVKRQKRFTVVIGNPPYSGISSNNSEYAMRLVDAYKIIDGEALNERKLWLQDDYVKFIRKAQMTLNCTGVGVFGFITNHGYLGNPTFRGMRQSLLGTFSRLRVLDLHGNSNRKEQCPDGSPDKPVFDIKQGVGICLAVSAAGTRAVGHAELWGEADGKLAWLSKRRQSDTDFTTLNPDSPYYFFVPQNIDCRAEYDAGWKINEAMPVNSAGFITARDHFVTDFDESALLARIADFAKPKVTDAEIRTKYFAGCGSDKYPEGDTRGWKIPAARQRVQSDKKWKERLATCLYRPFDYRTVYWADWMVDWPRPEVMGQMLQGDNLALLTARSNKTSGTDHFFCSSYISEAKCAEYSTQSAVFPLYTFQRATTAQGGLALGFEKQPNFETAFLRQLASALNLGQAKPHGLPASLTPEDIFNYTYAVFHSPGYRSRYAEFLKIDFPRLPLTGNLELFRMLARLGGELTALHLLESPRLDQPITEFVGSRTPEVEKVSWTRDTVWVDKAQTLGFRGVREPVWNFHIGGYQVCEKWLKDRKGRKLTKDDVEHYQKIVVALSESIRLMAEIDKVIDEHGGWPGAFQATK